MVLDTQYSSLNGKYNLSSQKNGTDQTIIGLLEVSKTREVWQEMHRLFDSISEDKAYHFCLRFFSYQKRADDDIATHMYKLDGNERYNRVTRAITHL
ncbi:hypothetical protein JTB14_001155 [Gonioctena quinquepunctata]|nr:hypothetical protein JTB14_001155 [Gonioctena quinquepunctata]